MPASPPRRWSSGGCWTRRSSAGTNWADGPRGRENLIAIWQWKDDYEARIIGQLKQMGCSCDWQRTRFTLDEVCARAVRETFFTLFKEGKIYRGKRLVNWDTFLQTAVSDDEVFHEPVKGHFWHFKYPVVRNIASRASRRTSPSPPRGRRRCSAIRPWPCIPIRPLRSNKAEEDLRAATGRRPGQGEAGHSGPNRRDRAPPAARCCRNWKRSATWPCAGVDAGAAADRPEDSADRRPVGEARAWAPAA